MSKKGYMPQLDGLRAFAVIAVVSYHTIPSLAWLQVGTLGVRLFFVLSGFLITGILVKARDDAALMGSGLPRVFRSFYVRRALRIFPAYYAAIGIMFIVGSTDLDRAIWHIFYLSNYQHYATGTLDVKAVHFWSLAVEEQFYLFWPTLILLTPRRFLVGFIVACIASAPLLRFSIYALTRHDISNTAVFSSMDCLGAGALLAVAWIDGFRNYLLAWRRPTLLFALAAVLALLVYAKQPRPLSGLLMVVLLNSACAVIFTWLTDAAAAGFAGLPGRVLELAPLRYVGRISYGIYIYHMMVLDVLIYLGISGDWILFAATAACSIGAASISWYLLEKPLNDLKRFFPYVWRSTAAPASSSEATAV